jgi:nitroimidazol reductase NimA-like FMN-containing flavoprotein (pyridoxamine 5'-phosphate oxidase superfamily)
MEEEAIRGFLTSHSVGVLGLPADGAPSLRPMSFWFDGDSRLYLLYILGEQSRKAELTERADSARFLVYSAETPFNWRSVLLTGELRPVPEGGLGPVREALENAWRPAVFEDLIAGDDAEVYELRISDRVGLEASGLPPAFETDK